jgi:hypothetical protein
MLWPYKIAINSELTTNTKDVAKGSYVRSFRLKLEIDSLQAFLHLTIHKTTQDRALFPQK